MQSVIIDPSDGGVQWDGPRKERFPVTLTQSFSERALITGQNIMAWVESIVQYYFLQRAYSVLYNNEAIVVSNRCEAFEHVVARMTQ